MPNTVKALGRNNVNNTIVATCYVCGVDLVRVTIKGGDTYHGDNHPAVAKAINSAGRSAQNAVNAGAAVWVKGPFSPLLAHARCAPR